MDIQWKRCLPRTGICGKVSDEVPDERNMIEKVLEDCVELGLVEVVGINPDGEWLYGATTKGLAILNDRDGIQAAYDALIALHKIEDEED